MRAWIRTVLLGAALVAPPVAMAAETVAPPLDAVRAEQRRIRAEAEAGTGALAQMPAAARAELLRRQAALDALLAGHASLDELDEAGRAEARRTLDWIAATVERAEGDREVCRTEKKTGSNRHTRVCRTVREMREEREEAQRAMNRAPICTDPKLCNGS